MPNRTEQNPKGGRRLNLWSLPPLLFPNSPVIVFYIIALLSISTGRSNNKLPPPKTPLLPRGVRLLVGGGDTSLLQGVSFGEGSIAVLRFSWLEHWRICLWLIEWYWLKGCSPFGARRWLFVYSAVLLPAFRAAPHETAWHRQWKQLQHIQSELLSAIVNIYFYFMHSHPR